MVKPPQMRAKEALQPEAEKYSISGLADEVPLVEDLSNTERAMLREMAEPGNPLWKIFRSMLDYGESLQQSLVMIDMDDESSRRAGRKVQATIIAIHWVKSTFEQALTDRPEQELKE